MDLVIEALKNQAKKEKDRIDKKDPKANEQYLEELHQAVKTLTLAMAINDFLDR